MFKSHRVKVVEYPPNWIMMKGGKNEAIKKANLKYNSLLKTLKMEYAKIPENKKNATKWFKEKYPKILLKNISDEVFQQKIDEFKERLQRRFERISNTRRRAARTSL